MSESEKYFDKYRKKIIGINQIHNFSAGTKKIIYADWTASGRLYQPIENYISQVVGPYVANTHTESSLTGTAMTQLYLQARDIIKKHVNASSDDVIITAGSGMTSVINKFQRLLNLRVPEAFNSCIEKVLTEKPLIILTHMEHHSNQTSWLACLCDVEIIQRSSSGLPDLTHLEEILEKNRNRKIKIGSFTACSNATGALTPIYKMSAIMHKHKGLCFVDYTAAAPYIKMDMHPNDTTQKLDAVFFSPHKFLGGPGSAGVLIFDKNLYTNKTPDHPGGGTVRWTNPWGGHRFIDDIEAREDGGTPGFLQTIKAAACILLKEEMGVDKIHEREEELKLTFISELKKISTIHILEPELERLGIVSFFHEEIHYNLIVKLLNDRFGIQTRGGCSCSGTYGHILFGVDLQRSSNITNKIDQGVLSEKPGWVRVSLHPTMSSEEVLFIAKAVGEVVENYKIWEKEYEFDSATAEFIHRDHKNEKAILNLMDIDLS